MSSRTITRLAPEFDEEAQAAPGEPRVMFYSHDTYGLGHLRRTLALATHLRSRRRLSQLIVTGSPLAHRFRFPRGADYVKLPSVRKVAAGDYEARFLQLPFSAIRALRADLLRGAARHFRPHLLVVDNVPAGLKGELVETLNDLKTTSCRLILGLRDVVDDADWVRRAWAMDGSYELLERVYDRILVYGEPDVYDARAQYAFPEDVAAKTRFVGYLGRKPGERTTGEVRTLLDLGDRRLVLVMAGGGEDGYELLRSVVDALRLRADEPAFECLLCGGPLMPARDRREVLELARRHSVRYIDFLDDIASYIEAADVVVSMGGYNSVCELLSSGKRALIVPRISPRREQLIRAEALSRLGYLEMLHPADVSPDRLLEAMNRLLQAEQPPPRLELRGLSGATAAVDELLTPETRLVAAGTRHG